ncbi:unnamed protein product [Arabidopsis thaliana]|uniref:(thale cress) hypothetical protein n=1 Tax=Arabidopsis thaliana TaxID=3702 RepID=A0A7G2DUA1_ARATH|nr:unnamed protein product [Arabidopsis thaliana]
MHDKKIEIKEEGHIIGEKQKFIFRDKQNRHCGWHQYEHRLPSPQFLLAVSHMIYKAEDDVTLTQAFDELNHLCVPLVKLQPLMGIDAAMNEPEVKTTASRRSELKELPPRDVALEEIKARDSAEQLGFMDLGAGFIKSIQQIRGPNGRRGSGQPEKWISDHQNRKQKGSVVVVGRVTKGDKEFARCGTETRELEEHRSAVIMKRQEIDHIPFDLTVEILTRLPAKSLMKFKCVSKLWSSIIHNQSFIDSFYSISSTRPRFIVAFSNGSFPSDKEKRLFIFSSSHEGHESSSSVITNLDTTIPSLTVSNNLASRCVSVNGFIACSLYTRFTICNPSTRQVIVLPILPSGRAPDMRSTCIGYDPVDDQFKALALISSRIPNKDSTVEHLVLTLKGDKKNYSWRQIQGNNNIPPYSPVTMRVCINGVCFDVRSEKITFIKTPKDVISRNKNGQSKHVRFLSLCGILLRTLTCLFQKQRRLEELGLKELQMMKILGGAMELEVVNVTSLSHRNMLKL